MLITTLTSLITIVTVPLGGMVGEYKCGDIGGNYNLGTKIVSLCQGVEGDTERYKYHEIGHYFYFNLLSKEQKDQYHKEYIKAYSEGKGSFFREYGYNSEIEDFADNMSFMILKKRQPYKIQKRINLIKKFMNDTSI